MAYKFEYYDTGADQYATIYGVQWRGQTFTPSVGHTITSVKLLCYRSGLPGTVTVSIRATVSDDPYGPDLCSGTTDGDTLTTDTAGEWREITLGAGATLTVNTKYAIVVRATAGDASNDLRWVADSTSPTYTGGWYETSGDSGSTWNGLDSWDFLFEDWGIVEYARSLSVAVGLTASVSTQRAFSRSLTAPIGLTALLSKAATYGRALTTALGLSASIGARRNMDTWLVVASQDQGSVRTRNSGTTWSVCAKDAAGRGTLPAAWLATFDNRLCALSYQLADFSYSAVHDLAANWTDKESFPNLPVQFTGMFVGKDASDNPALYFLTPRGMYYLDVFTNFVFGPTEVTWEEDSTSGKKGLYWKGDTYVAVGKGIYKVSAGVVSLVGPDMDDGLPEDMQGTVTDMIGVGFWLVIAVDGGASNKSSILKRYITGKHWHPVYVTSAANTPIRALAWDDGTLYFGEGTNVKSLPFPTITDNINKLSTQTRATTGTLTYPWFHSVFETMPKVAHKVWATTRDCNANDKITIHYRKDEETAWTLLGSFATSPRPTALSFGSAGVQFERIQFRATYDRGATTTNSPKVESLVLEYRVIPPTLWGWDVRVVARTQGDVKGDDILAALKTATETGTLLAFYPSGDKSKTCYYVEVKGVPGNEAGTEFGTEGIYQISLQEVVG